MIFSSPFSSANFKDLEPGDFFFHPLAGGHSPALTVTRSDGINSVVDLNCEQQNGARLPTLMSPDTFEDLTVIAVKSAIIRPKLDTNALINGAGAASSIDQSSLVMALLETFLK